MARGKTQGPLQAHQVSSTLEESDESQTIQDASKHVVDDEGTWLSGSVKGKIASCVDDLLQLDIKQATRNY
eukprot:12906067-Prorocentrum_lima.AAC.1